MSEDKVVKFINHKTLHESFGSEDLSFGDNDDENKLDLIFGDVPEAYLDSLIYTMATGTTPCSISSNGGTYTEINDKVISVPLNDDLSYIFNNIFKINLEELECPSGRAPYDLKEAPDLLVNIPNNIRQNVIFPRTDLSFDSSFATAAIIIPEILRLNNEAKFEECFSNLASKLNGSTISFETCISVDPLGRLNGYYAPTEEEVNAALPGNIKAMEAFMEGFNKSLTEASAKVIQSGMDFNIYEVDINSDVLLDLNLRNRVARIYRISKNTISDDTIRKNGIKAVPSKMYIKIVKVTTSVKTSKTGSSTTYKGNATGKTIWTYGYRIQSIVEYETRNAAKASKRLIPPPNKAYKYLDTASLQVSLDTLKTMFDIPGKMYVDAIITDNLYSGKQLIFRSKDFKRTLSTDKDIRAAISENLRTAFKGIDARDFLSFLQNITGIKADDDPSGISKGFIYLEGVGLNDMQLNFARNSPDNVDLLLKNLDSLKEVFYGLASEAETIKNYLDKSLKELEIDTTKKMSYRDLIIAITTNEVKADPLSLASKGGYLGNIGKEFI